MSKCDNEQKETGIWSQTAWQTVHVSIPQDDVSNIGHAHWTLYVRTIDPTQQDINQFQSKQKKRDLNFRGDMS